MQGNPTPEYRRQRSTEGLGPNRMRSSWRSKVLAGALVVTVGTTLALWPEATRHSAVGPTGPAPPPHPLPAAVVVGEAIAPLLAVVAAFEEIDAAQAGFAPGRLREAEAAVWREVRRGAFPGAALVVGRGEKVIERKGIGRTAAGGGAVDPDSTLYDLASLTKVVATTTAVMLLVEDGLMELDAPVSRYLPEWRSAAPTGPNAGAARERVTIRHLLAHTSGLPAGAGVGGTPDEALRRLLSTPLRWQPGERVVYSDLGPIALWAAADRVADEPLEELLERRVFAPLGMTSTRFRPELPCEQCAPTAPTVPQGRVHDPTARRLGGVAGNAGLFSTASDLGRFAAMLANGGELGGVRILREETIREFTRRQPRSATRALGWDTPSRQGGAAGSRISPRAFGHTGFTGTSLWIDPDRGTWTILLANRTYQPRGPNRMQALRRTVHDHVSAAVDVYAE
jgi:CubicO group peptidase (beta-lactamase class C family)